MTVSPGKVEIGQGIVTALAQIAADELDVDISRVQMVRASTAASPNEGVTSGSLSIQQSGRALRHACAEVRQIFLAAASDRLGVDIDALDDRGRHDLGTRQCQDQLLGTGRRGLARSRRHAGRDAETVGAARRWPDSSVQRIDIPDKVFARPRFIQDLALAGHAARPRAAAGNRAREADRAERRRRARRCRPRRDRPRRQFRRRGLRNRARRGSRTEGLAQGRDLVGRRAAAR